MSIGNNHKFSPCNQRLFCKEPPNELRIDAAGRTKSKKREQCSAASVLVELRRIWKKKPGGSGNRITRTESPPIKDDLGSILHEKGNAVKEKRKGKSRRKEIRGKAKRTEAKETTA
jgi:hypothetical protein